jgi:asparagine synthase (glutamine-hydrolysing)
MCGLVVVLAYGGDRVDAAELVRIRDAMVTRGPDGAGCWISPDRRIGLGHRRLSLLDLSEAGAQPMANQDGSLRVVFNGEIYNHEELRHSLEAHGFVFHSATDTEVLLHLYAAKGERMVDDLRGMYAFVLWDERRRRIFAARDPLGIKPLYYADDGATLRIASQVKALIAGGAISSHRDPAGQVGFLLWGYVPEPFSTYRAISALPAGAFLVAENGQRATIHHFCRIEDEAATAAANFDSDSEAKKLRERLRAVIADSVRRHLFADVPVGIFLSAGLDSTVVTALATESPNSRLNTITLGFREYRGSKRDETTLAQVVASLYGTFHQTRWVTRSDFRHDLDKVVAAMDQPSIDGVNTYFVAKATSETGLKAALSGIGGDELFGGYPSFAQVPLMVGTLAGAPLAKLGRALRFASAPLLGRFTSSKYAGLLEYGGRWGGAYLLRRALFMPWEIPQILDPGAANEGWQRLEMESRLENTVSGIESPFARVSALEVIWYMRNQLLRDADWAGMAHSIEIRTPLADIEVLRAVLPIAARGALRPHKRDLAELPSKPLPRTIVERSKMGFVVPVQEWLSEMDGNGSGRGLRGWGRWLAGEFGFELKPDSSRSVLTPEPT